MENTLIALAARFERIAAGLRGRAADIAKARQAREPGPVGLWRCTRADDWFAGYFTPGETYRADYTDGTTSIRIDHRKGGCWSPYWDHFAQRFCYPADRLDFEFVGATATA